MDNSKKSEKKPLTRHEEREQALGFIFESIFRDDETQDAFDDAFDARDIQVGSYAECLIKGVKEHKDEIDSIIEDNLKGWKKNRISKISLTILRMAVFELLYVKNVPQSVVINEAIELAKSYATAEDGSFVNGVLGSVVKNNKEKSGDK